MGRVGGRQTRIWVKSTKYIGLEKREEKNNTNILAEVLGNWVEFALTVLKMGRGETEYNTHKCVRNDPKCKILCF